MKNSKSTCGRPRCNNKVGSHVDRKTGDIKVHKNCDACNAEYRAKLGLRPFPVPSVKAKPKAQPKVEAKVEAQSQIASLEAQIQELKAALTRAVPTKAEQARASVEQIAKIVDKPKAKPKAKVSADLINNYDHLCYASSAELYSASDELPF